MSSYGTATWDEELFAPVRFRTPDLSPPLHASRCRAHGCWYRGDACPRCCLAVEEAELAAQVRRVRRAVARGDLLDRRCPCGARVPPGQRVYCSRACYLAESNQMRRRP